MQTLLYSLVAVILTVGSGFAATHQWQAPALAPQEQKGETAMSTLPSNAAQTVPAGDDSAIQRSAETSSPPGKAEAAGPAELVREWQRLLEALKSAPTERTPAPKPVVVSVEYGGRVDADHVGVAL